MLSLIDFILNIASLLLFLNWRAVRANTLPRAGGVSIVSTLKRAGPPVRRWLNLCGLAGLLFLRAGFYCAIGPAFHWDPKVPLGPTTVVFRSDFFGRMLLFSFTGFIVTMVIFYFWLLFLSCINSRLPDSDPQQKLIRLHLGWLERWPAFLKLILPCIGVMALWYVCNPMLEKMGMTPKASGWHLIGQSALVGLATCLSLKYLVIGFLLLHLLNSYVYLGESLFWNFVNATAAAIVRPLKPMPLRIGKIDLAPVVAIVVIFVAAEFSRRGLTKLYVKFS